MPDLPRLAESLAHAVADTPRAELPALIAELERARAIAWSRLATPEPMKATTQLVEAEEMGKLCGLTKYGVQERARRGVIPCVRAGKLIRFDPAEVLEALRQNGRAQDRTS